MSDGSASEGTARTHTTATKSSMPSNYTRRQRVFLNDHAKNAPFEYPDNSIQTSRYTLITFLPLFLKMQYQKASNIFLLIVCILTFIPSVSALSPAASLFPVIFVLLVAGLKEGWEDWKRHRADSKANSIEVRVLRRRQPSSSSSSSFPPPPPENKNVVRVSDNNDDDDADDDEYEWVKIPSSDVQAGDITLYEHGDEIRADSIVLSTSNDDGVAFIETANLDGETTLKIRRAPKICARHLSSEQDVMRVTAEHGVAVVAGEANADLSKFRAAIHIGGREAQPDLMEDELELQRAKDLRSGRTRRKKQAGGEDADDAASSNGGSSIKSGGGSSSGTATTAPPGSGASGAGGVAKLGVDINCFLFRGSMLRNTEWALCATIYTGINTKMFLNLKQIPPRMSTLDSAVNQMIIFLLIVHQIVIIIVAGMAVGWSKENSCNHAAGITTWYIRSKSVAGCDFGAIFWLKYLGYFVLLSFILPASLFVTIELAKAIQAVFMSWDHGMATFHVASGEWLMCKPKTSTLNEQLGVVRYVFTDKTGTLTQNQMNVVQMCYDEVELADDATGAVAHTVAKKVLAVEQQLMGDTAASPPPSLSSAAGETTWNSQRNGFDATNNSDSPVVDTSLSADELTLLRQRECARQEKEDMMLDRLSNRLELGQIDEDELQEAEEAILRRRQARALDLLRDDPLHLLLLNMATCHSVVCFDNKTHPLLKTYEGPSQDELALTASARRNGYALMDRKTQGVAVNLPGANMTLMFDVLAELEFTSERGMMSVLVKDAIHQEATVTEQSPQGEARYILFCKGGDGAVFARCALATERNARKHRQILHQLDEMCSEGLRTLVFAYRVVSEKEKTHWLKKFETAKCAVSENRNEIMAEVAGELEHGLDLVGVVGIEDKLQDAVPETIHFFREAGITVWMLTGDKRETAVAIAETSRLIDPRTDLVAHINLVSLVADDETTIEEVEAVSLEQMRQIVAAFMGRKDYYDKKRQQERADEFKQQQQQQQLGGEDHALGAEPDEEQRERRERLIREHPARLDPPGSSPSLKKRSSSSSDQQQPASGFDAAIKKMDDDADGKQGGGGDYSSSETPLVLVADGVSLKAALHSNEGEFMYVALMAKSAVCCRLSPLLKAKLVGLFQSCTSETVLAIGDGANDVSMIQESMVGVGIMGLEGSQAELSAAYAIPQFKALKRLMIVHGRYAWYRTTTCMCYTIFKNAALTLCLFYFSFFSAFSGSTLYDSWLLTMFNTFFTQATPLLLGGVDTDVDDDVLMNYPDLYGYIRRDKEYFNARTFTFWICDTIATSLVVFFLALSMMNADDMGRGETILANPEAATNPGSNSITGMSLDHYGTISFLVLLVLVDAYALVTQQLYSSMSGVIVFLNWCLIPSIMFGYGSIPIDSSFTYTLIPDEVLSDRLFYIFMWVANALVVICLRIATRRLIRMIWPSATEEAIKKRTAEWAELQQKRRAEKEDEEEEEKEKEAHANTKSPIEVVDEG